MISAILFNGDTRTRRKVNAVSQILQRRSNQGQESRDIERVLDNCTTRTDEINRRLNQSSIVFCLLPFEQEQKLYRIIDNHCEFPAQEQGAARRGADPLFKDSREEATFTEMFQNEIWSELAARRQDIDTICIFVGNDAILMTDVADEFKQCMDKDIRSRKPQLTSLRDTAFSRLCERTASPSTLDMGSSSDEQSTSRESSPNYVPVTSKRGQAVPRRLSTPRTSSGGEPYKPYEGRCV